MYIDSSKVRLIWKEYCDDTNKIYPGISFDNGKTWMKFDETVDMIRKDHEDKDVKINKATTNPTSNLTEMDISVSMTPYVTPAIVKIEAVDMPANRIDSTKSENQSCWEPNVDYYFVATTTNFDNPGLNALEDLTIDDIVDKHVYYDGKDIKEAVSNVAHFRLNDGDINKDLAIYVNYPSFVEGLNIYCATKESGSEDHLKFNLIYISNLCNKLLSDMSPDDDYGSKIFLSNIFPFPKKGVFQVDNEYIEYDKCGWDNESGHWYLKIARDGRANNYKVSHSKNTPVYLVTNDEYKRRLPLRNYNFDVNSSVKLYLTFNSESCFDACTQKDYSDHLKNSTGAKYEMFDTSYGISYYNDGESLLTIDLPTVEDNGVTKISSEGTLYFNFVLTGMDNTLGSTPYLIYPVTEGIYAKLNKTNRKLEIGYTGTINNSFVTIPIISSEDLSNKALSQTSFNTIAISWQPTNKEKLDDATTMMVFEYQMGDNKYKVTTDIKCSDFRNNDNTHLNLGGVGFNDTTKKAENYVIGYFDNIRCLDQDIFDNKDTDINSITYNKLKYEDKHSTIMAGKVTLISNEYSYNEYKINDDENDGMNYLYDYTGNTNILKTVRSNNYMDSDMETLLSDMNEFGLIDGDSTKENSLPLLKSDSPDIKYHYEPKYHTSIDVTVDNALPSVTEDTLVYIDMTNANDEIEPNGEIELNQGETYLVKVVNNNDGSQKINPILKDTRYVTINYDNWIMQLFGTNDADWYYTFKNITYPIRPRTIQVKYDLFVDDDHVGFTTPFLYSPSTIISDAGVGEK